MSDASRWFVRGSWAWLNLGRGSRPRRVARRWSVAVASYLLARPRLAQPVRQLLRGFPAIEERFRMILLSPADTQRAPIQSVAVALSDLSPRARGVYAELKAAIAKREASR
jgi:hypothetical protein